MKTNHPAEGWLTPGGSMEAGTQLDEGRDGPGVRGPWRARQRPDMTQRRAQDWLQLCVDLRDPSGPESCPFMCEEAGKCVSQF